jgi:predicted permease
LAGGVAGLAVAYGGVQLLLSIPVPSDFPISFGVRMDTRLLMFSFAATIATGLIFGLMPALRVTRADLSGTIKSSDQGPAQHARWRGRLAGRNLLVIAQLTFSVVLLILSAFFVRGFAAVRNLNPGFRIDHTLFFSMDASLARYDQSKAREFFRNLENRLREQPGVRDVAFSWTIPFNAGQLLTQRVVVDGYEQKAGQDYPAAWSNTVDEHFFPLMEMPILKGRAFDSRDSAGSPRVVIVNETFGARMWPNRDPIGQRFRLDSPDGREAQVIGVTKAAKYAYWAESPQMAFWLPFSQNYESHVMFEVRTAGDPAVMAAIARSQVRALDPDMPVIRTSTMAAFYHDRFLLGPRLLAQLVTAIGLIGLLLAVIGLYGVVAYAVSRRTREIGIRMAIGARPGDMLRMVLGQGFVFTIVGVVIGGVIAIAAGGYAQSFVIGASPRDPLTLAAVVAILTAVMMIACWVPARRASRVDPVRALKQD